MPVRALLGFPKRRPPLPEAYRRIYETQYALNRGGATPASGLAQTMEGWMHRRVAADGGGVGRETLELGAGNLNQLTFESPCGAYDIVEPQRYLYENHPDLDRVRNAYSDISEVPGDTRFDRITSVAVLEHICDLPAVVARCALMLREETSTFRAGIPSEGTPLWYLGWRLTTGLEFLLRHRLDYGVLMKHEHVNTAREIEAVLGHFFRAVHVEVFGACRWLSLYRFLECSDPDREACRAFLAGGHAGS